MTEPLGIILIFIAVGFCGFFTGVAWGKSLKRAELMPWIDRLVEDNERLLRATPAFKQAEALLRGRSLQDAVKSETKH